MKTGSLTYPTSDTERLLRLLSRWALVTVLLGVALLAVFMGGIGFVPSDNALGVVYSDLLQAARTPTMYRIFATLDASGWLMMGGGLLILALISIKNMLVRSLMITACGIGLLSGLLGGVLRLVGISDLAARYVVATSSQQQSLLQATLAVMEVVDALFVVGDFLAGAGWLLVASVASRLPVFPRWLAIWFGVAGLLSLLQGTTSALGEFSFPVLLMTILLGILGLNAAIAVTFWNPSPRLVSDLVGN